MELRLKIHSLIDVITNSSTEIYTYVTGSVESVYDLLNEILKVADSDKKAYDLFTVNIEYENWDSIIDNIKEHVYQVDEDHAKHLVKLFDESDKSEDWKERNKYEEKNIIPYIEKHDLIDKYVEVDYDDMYTLRSSISVLSKDKSVSNRNIIGLFWGLFSQEAMYNG